jgi:hypothetical protein
LIASQPPIRRLFLNRILGFFTTLSIAFSLIPGALAIYK